MSDIGIINQMDSGVSSEAVMMTSGGARYQVVGWQGCNMSYSIKKYQYCNDYQHEKIRNISELI